MKEVVALIKKEMLLHANKMSILTCTTGDASVDLGMLAAICFYVGIPDTAESAR